jgi:hypothetical protein
MVECKGIAKRSEERCCSVIAFGRLRKLYCPRRILLSLIASVVLTAVLSATTPVVGEVTHYAGPTKEGGSSLMKKVWNWRVWKGHVPECPECVDAVALIDPEHIGEKVWLRHPNGDIVGPLMVVDCAEAKHRANLRKRGWVADISWELAMKWHMNGPLEGVTVLFEPPPGWEN